MPFATSSTTVEVAKIKEEQDVEAEIQELEDLFFQFVYKAQSDLERIELSKVKFCVIQLPVSLKSYYHKFLTGNIAAIQNAESVSEIFSILSMYWDFLNCELLVHIVRRLGNDELNKQMAAYMETLTLFLRRTTLEAFIGKWARSVPPQFAKFVTYMAGDWRNRTLQDLKDFRMELARTMLVEEYALPFKIINPGSVLVTWAIPSSLPGIADTLQSIFPQLDVEYDVLMVVFQGKHIPESNELAPLEVCYYYQHSALSKGGIFN